VLLALAATAYHAVSGGGKRDPIVAPDLIIGHGVLGRLLARLTVAAGLPPPTVWERNATRALGATNYPVLTPDEDPRRDYHAIYDASGDVRILDAAIARLAKGGEVVLAGFYAEPLSFNFAPAFMREATIRCAAEWQRADMLAVKQLAESGALRLDGSDHTPGAGRQRARGLSNCVQRRSLSEDGPGLENPPMNAPESPILLMRDAALKAEAAIEPDPVHTSPAAKTTQIIAIYGKGGIGKSFTLANLSYMMAQQGKKVLLIGCDPKSDTTSLLFGGKACPTIIETSSKKKLAGEAVAIGDVCFKRDGVYAMELGGPEVGRGCGGRGIIHGFETLEKLGFHDWGFDYVLLDFLGDVVCGGFGLPIARDMCQKVIVVASNDLQSLYVANNVCSAVEYFRKLGGNVGVAGMVINKDDGTGEAQAFAANAGIPVLAAIPGQRRHPPQERQLRNHRPPRHAVGFGL
jgi:chlorophyllide a reductase subunit X